MSIQNFLIFVPNSLNLSKTGYLEGFSRCGKAFQAFYITGDKIVKKNSPDKVIGCIGEKKDFQGRKHIAIDPGTSEISVLPSAGHNSSLVTIFYNYEAFRSSLLLSNGSEYGDHFQALAEAITRRRAKDSTNGRRNTFGNILAFILTILEWFIKILDKSKAVTLHSATLTHFHESTLNFKWCLSELARKKQITPKLGNVLLSRLLDVVIGLFLLKLCIDNEKFILKFIGETREVIIDKLKTLLTYLMGAPIGLKLNKAFNNCLGTFFFYYISLWRVFLYTLQPLIARSFIFLVLPGAFGFSFQIALISDVISIATFHVYCTYVYAASLIYFQLRSLLGLWRLFIGRKYNPLRERVDSYQYSQRQLFIGTLGFTVLLFLLPTTTLYYAVFTVFRVLIFATNGLLLRLRHFLNRLPLYVIILWIIKSPNVAGTLQLKWKECKVHTKLEVDLKPLSLAICLRKFNLASPKVDVFSWGSALSKIMTGILI